MSEKILYVDDDPNVLMAYQRMLRRQFHVATAQGGPEGLEVVARDGPFAVVISDMRMPGMNGIEFLRELELRAPDTVRMMLTGNADLPTAIQAVNEGHIFRFLTKPCERDVLTRALQAGIQQYRLVIAERQLLEETLNGSITVLVDVLSLVNPTAFGRAARIKRYVKHMAARLALPNAWQVEVAAMLSQIGCVALPPDVLQKVYAGEDLSDEEERMFTSHPDVGGRLIVNIPHLEDIARMIARQHEPMQQADLSPSLQPLDPVAVGAQILKAALEFDRLVAHGEQPEAAVRQLAERPDDYAPHIVAALEDVPVRPPNSLPRALPVRELDAHMVLDEDVHAANGNLLVTRGQELTFPILERLRRWTHGVGVKEPIRVLVPRYGSREELAAADALVGASTA